MKNQIKKTSLVTVLLAMLGGNAVFAQSASPTPTPTAEPTTAPAQNVIEGDIVAHASEKNSKREVLYTSDAKNNRANFYLIDAAGNPKLLTSIQVKNEAELELQTNRYKFRFLKTMTKATITANKWIYTDPDGRVAFAASSSIGGLAGAVGTIMVVQAVTPLLIAFTAPAAVFVLAPNVPFLVGIAALPIDAVITGIAAIGPKAKAEHSFKDLLRGQDSELSQRAFGKLVSGLQKL